MHCVDLLGLLICDYCKVVVELSSVSPMSKVETPVAYFVFAMVMKRKYKTICVCLKVAVFFSFWNEETLIFRKNRFS